MARPKALFTLFVVLCSATMAFAEPKEKEKEKEKGVDAEKATMIVHLADDGTDHGLMIVYPKAISASARKSVKFPIMVANLLEEEVFLEVTEYDDLGYELGNQVTGPWAVGGGSEIAFPDNTRLLKRLHASSYKNGKAFTCGCATAFISAQVAFDEDASLKEFIGQTAGIQISLKGYYRGNGKEFQKSAKLPVEIVK